jgi:hypothetical protein
VSFPLVGNPSDCSGSQKRFWTSQNDRNKELQQRPQGVKFIKYISTEEDILYSYQLYIDKAIARWDNEPHYPDLNNYPHHFHYKDNIGASQLSGNPMQDVKKVCSFVKGMIESISMTP